MAPSGPPEQIQTLPVTREQLVKQKTVTLNSLDAHGDRGPGGHLRPPGRAPLVITDGFSPTPRYFEGKRAEGKPKRLVWNNLASKLLRILCAMLKNDRMPYVENYQSVHPRLLKG